jgi:hypothetical protein
MSIRFPNSKFIANTKVSGNLYDLGAYPGLVLNESDSLVVGEVYEVDDEILKKLDEFEASSNYLRKQVEISLLCTAHNVAESLSRLAPGESGVLEGVRDFRIDPEIVKRNQLINGWYRNG